MASLLLLLFYYLLAPTFSYEVVVNTAISAVIFRVVLYLNLRDRFPLTRFIFLAATLTHCIYFSTFIRPNETVELRTLIVILAGVILYRGFITHLTIFLMSLLAALISHLIFQNGIAIHPLPAISMYQTWEGIILDLLMIERPSCLVWLFYCFTAAYSCTSFPKVSISCSVCRALITARVIQSLSGLG